MNKLYHCEIIGSDQEEEMRENTNIEYSTLNLMVKGIKYKVQIYISS